MHLAYPAEYADLRWTIDPGIKLVPIAILWPVNPGILCVYIISFLGPDVLVFLSAGHYDGLGQQRHHFVVRVVSRTTVTEGTASIPAEIPDFKRTSNHGVEAWQAPPGEGMPTLASGGQRPIGLVCFTH